MISRYGWRCILLALMFFSTSGCGMAMPGLQPGGVTADASGCEDVPGKYPEGYEEAAVRELLATSPIDRALEVARSLLGTPYARGGTGPGGFDCSGLVQYVFRQVGIDLPRSSREQYGKVSLVSLKELKPGDLLFFRIARRRISHVGIYVDEDRFIHAPSNGKGVSYAALSEPYWKKRLVGAGRLDVGEGGKS